MRPAAPAKTPVAVPSLSATRVQKTGNVQKPTVPANAQYTADFGGGDYIDYGKYLVTVTLNDPANYQWSDGTSGPKVLPFIIEHVNNVFSGHVRSFIQGDTAPKIMLSRPRYQGRVSCSYTEDQLNDLAPGTYTASITAHECELATPARTRTCKFTVYPAGTTATHTYEYADLNGAYFKTDYAPAIGTDKVEVRMMDQTADEGYAPFSCGPYPASMTIMKKSGGILRYPPGARRVALSSLSWAVNKIYTLTAQGKTITHKDEATGTTKSASFTGTDLATPATGTAFIGCSVEKSADRGAEGAPGYHQPHRLYHVKIWNNGTTPR